MKDIHAPLDEDELDILDRFLLSRVDEDADTGDRDEGVLDVSELDGLLTAVVSGPVLIQPSRWLPAVWGDFEPEWESDEDFEAILTLMMRHMNGIAVTLMEQPQDFEPLFFECEAKGKACAIVDEWCNGYMRGVSLTMDDWDTGGREITDLLTPLIVFVSEKGWEMLDRMSDDEVENLQQTIAPNVRRMHAFWLARRQESPLSTAPTRQPESQVGPDDPCPCGSGKKYKKCCLH